ncbi:MAG TPA: D-alanyl-D-alanine carboxypeptidase/D-alanyl-D-alanine-endopeptidase [Ignavibacteriaceae bacterium]|nr:D-alanyl-D-alanine carboxypeptidase/D-alanyl-D-alanine-endopeptidase [Ignavibacteriaceae bacterium]
MKKTLSIFSMKSQIIFLFVLCFVFLQVEKTIYSQNIKELKSVIEKHSKGKTLKNGFVAVYASFADDCKEIISFNSEKSLAPASNLKVVTSAAALMINGEDHKFVTKIYHDGKLDDSGKLNGNIYIVGGGDPTLGSSQVRGSVELDELMNNIKNAISYFGIKEINGNVLADDLLYERNPVPNYWPWIDIGNYYGAGTSALCIYDNLYHLEFKPGEKVGDPADVIGTVPNIPGLKFINYMKTGAVGSGDNGYIYNAPFSYEATLRGTIPAGVEKFSIKGSMPDPALFTAQKIIEVLKDNGIPVSGFSSKVEEKGNYNENKLIYKIDSPPLKDIVYIVNKRSNNLYTEQLLVSLFKEKDSQSSTRKGIKAMMDFSKKAGIPIEGVELDDGSGLSRTNMITTKCIASVLNYMSNQKEFESYYFSFPIAGDTTDIGGFKRFGLGTVIEKNARIKSGTISGVRAFSGYMKNKSGRLISFSMIANNYTGSSKNVDEIFKEILVLLY